MEELKKETNYLEAKRNQNEGLSYIRTSCFLCKCTPHYMEAIPYLRTAADYFLGLSKKYPHVYKDKLALEEVKCREKLISCLHKVGSFKDAGDQGIKLAKLYIRYVFDLDCAYKTMQNFTMDLIQTNSLNNNTLQRCLKGIAELAKDFYEVNAFKHAEKSYNLLFNTAFSAFPGQAKSNEPYHYIYEAFYIYFDYLITIREHDKCIREIIKAIELISPTNEQLSLKTNILGKENDLDAILTFYYKLLAIFISLEDEERFNQFFQKAQEMRQDSTQQLILDKLKEAYNICLKGDEIKFIEIIKFLSLVLDPVETTELRGIMKKYKKYDFSLENYKIIDENVFPIETIAEECYKYKTALNRENNKNTNTMLSQNIELKNEKIETNASWDNNSSFNKEPKMIKRAEESLFASTPDLAKETAKIQFKQNSNLEQISNINDKIADIKKPSEISPEVLHNKNYYKDSNHNYNEPNKNNRIKNEDLGTPSDVKTFIEILDDNKSPMTKHNGRNSANDYL